LDAAHIAKWNVLRLLHETSASLVAYCIPRKWDESHTVAIIDIGHAHLQVSVARINGSECNVLSYVYDEHVGGRNFDALLADFAIEECEAETSVSAMSPAMQKGRLRIWRECEKAKRILSTNKDVLLSLDCIPDLQGNVGDINVRITREQFEKKASAMLCRIQNVFETSLKIAGVDRVDNVEMVGGSSRIPCIISCIATCRKQEPQRTLDSSECVAKGCAYVAAMLSPRYKSRSFTIHDLSIYETSLCIGDTVVIIYNANTRLESTKKIALSVSPPTKLRCIYSRGQSLNHQTGHVITHVITSTGGDGTPCGSGDCNGDDSRERKAIGDCKEKEDDTTTFKSREDYNGHLHGHCSATNEFNQDEVVLGECTVEHKNNISKGARATRLRVHLIVSIDLNGIFRFVTLKPIKTRQATSDVADLKFTFKYDGQAGPVAFSDIERRNDSFEADDSIFAKCDELRNQLATLLYEKRGQYSDEMVEELYQAVDDDTTALSILTTLLQRMQDTRTADTNATIDRVDHRVDHHGALIA
jgi:hypothetical protein